MTTITKLSNEDLISFARAHLVNHMPIPDETLVLILDRLEIATESCTTLSQQRRAAIERMAEVKIGLDELAGKFRNQAE